MKLSDYIVKFLEKQKLKDVFMVSGGGCMHLINSFGSSKKIKYWCTQHEQSAAMAAEAYSKMNNSLGVVVTTSGPGATNAITGLLDCYQDSTPVLFISGQAKKMQTVHNSGIPSLRQFGVQEADIIPVVQPLTKYAVEIDNPDKIKYYMERAVYTATSGRPGPVWLSIPLDIQSADINEGELIGWNKLENCSTEISTYELDDFWTMLKSAKRPVIIGGHGVRLSNACNLLEEFASQYHIPIVTSFMGIDIIPDKHLCNIGRIGTKGTRAGNFTIQNADLIISIGCRLPVSIIGHNYELFAREAKIVVVDIDSDEHSKKTINIDKFIFSDAKLFLKALMSKNDKPINFSSWLDQCQAWKKKYPIILDTYENDSDGINYYKFVDMLNCFSNEKTPIISDAGSSFYVVAQTIQIKEGQRHITTGGTATMGFGVPAAIGVAVATPQNTIICVTGDGSFMQNLQEIEVIKYHNMNIKVFIMCNNAYFSIHQTQKKFFNGHYVGAGPESGISISNIEKIASAFAIDYYKIDTIKNGNYIISEVFEKEGPAIIEVTTSENMEIIPTNASMMRADGKMVSKPLEDMYPFLPREEFLSEMIIEPVYYD